MKLSTWRPLIKGYFNQLLTPTGWFVDTPPDLVKRYGTMPPIAMISFTHKPPYEVVATISQEVYYMERVGIEQWHSIPIEYYEGLYGQVVYSMLIDSKTMHPDIISLSIGDTDMGGYTRELPVTTEQLADSWLISLRWGFTAKVLISPEIEETPIPITNITTELWTNLLSDSTFAEQYRVLDTTVTSQE